MNPADDSVPYDENAWQRIVDELGDEMPEAPAPIAPPPPEPEEGTFEPPEPPPLPRPDLIGKVAWAGALGGPLVLFLGVLFPGVVGPGLVTIAIAAFVAGFLTLVLRHPNEPEDGWDDGSVV